jgi:hypothetical protein
LYGAFRCQVVVKRFGLLLRGMIKRTEGARHLVREQGCSTLDIDEL